MSTRNNIAHRKVGSKAWLYSATALLSAVAPTFAHAQTPAANPFNQSFSFTFSQPVSTGFNQPLDAVIPLNMPQTFNYVIPAGTTATNSAVASLSNVNITTSTTTQENISACNVFFPCPTATVNQSVALTASSPLLGFTAATNNTVATFNLPSLPPTVTRQAQYMGLTSNPVLVPLTPVGGSSGSGAFPITFDLEVKSPSIVNRQFLTLSGTVTGTLGLADNSAGVPLPPPAPPTPTPPSNPSGPPSQPGAPQVPVIQQNPALKQLEEANAQFLATTSVILAVFSPLTAPLSIGLLGGEAALLHAMAQADPIDTNYKVIATPQAVTLPNTGPTTALNADVARMIALNDAAITSINRYSGAAAAGDAASAQAQLDAFRNYQDETLALLKAVGVDITALNASGLSPTVLTEAQIVALKQQIASGVLAPSATLQQLGITLDGLSSSDLDAMFAQLAAMVDPTSAAGIYPDRFATLGAEFTDNTSVPEPASIAILGCGLLGFLAVRRKTA